MALWCARRSPPRDRARENGDLAPSALSGSLALPSLSLFPLRPCLLLRSAGAMAESSGASSRPSQLLQSGYAPSFVGARLGPAAPPPPPAARPSARPVAVPTALQSRPCSRTEPWRRAGHWPRPPPVNAGAGRGHHLVRASLPSRTSKPRPAAVPFPKHGRLPCLSLCLQEEDPLLSLSLYDRCDKKGPTGPHGSGAG